MSENGNRIFAGKRAVISALRQATDYFFPYYSIKTNKKGREPRGFPAF